MFFGMLKGAGLAIAIVLAVALWVVPNPIGKVVQFWRFWRGE